MDVIRIQFETQKYEYRRVRRTYDNSVRHFRVGGKTQPYKGIVPSTYYSAKSRYTPETRDIAGFHTSYYQDDNSHMFDSYDDAIELGYFFDQNPRIGGLSDNVKTDLKNDSLDALEDLSRKRQFIHYQGIFWGLYYTVVVDEGKDYETNIESTRFIDLHRFSEESIPGLRDQMESLLNEIFGLTSQYDNVILNEIFAKFRNDELEL